MNRRMLLTTGAAGIATVALLFGGQGLMQVGGSEPAFDAAASEIQRFFDTRDPGLFAIGGFLQTLGLVGFLWFAGGTYALLARAEEQPWRATIALVCGAVAVAVVITGPWQVAAFRAAEGLDPQLARYAFDAGNLGFANAWVALGSFALANGAAILSSRSLPHWLGWWAIAAGAGLVAARTVWTEPYWLLPYAVFWLWVIALSVLCVARAARPVSAPVISGSPA